MILFTILFVIYAAVDIWLKDKMLDEFMYTRWLYEGHPGVPCSTEFQCPVHRKPPAS